MEGSHPDIGTAFRTRSLTTSVDGRLRRLIASVLVILFTVPIAAAQPAQVAQSTAGQQQDTSARTATTQEQSTPPNTNDTAKPPSGAGNPIEAPSGSTEPAGPQESTSSPSAPEPQQSTPPKEPVGTAAAPLEKTTGIAASRPAGAAVAPAKQRRTRSILIKLGVILGAAAAIGIVIALSKGSPSRP